MAFPGVDLLYNVLREDIRDTRRIIILVCDRPTTSLFPAFLRQPAGVG